MNTYTLAKNTSYKFIDGFGIEQTLEFQHDIAGKPNLIGTRDEIVNELTNYRVDIRDRKGKTLNLKVYCSDIIDNVMRVIDYIDTIEAGG